jgi:ABC-type multidrug transport system fused ATPase/permease subunit
MTFILKFFGYRRVATLVIIVFINAVLDLGGIALLYPYLELATNFEKNIEKYHLHSLRNILRIDSANDFLIVIGVCLILFYFIKVITMYWLNKCQFKMLADMTYRLTEAMYSRLLRCSYNAFQQFPASQLMGVVYSNPIHATLCLTSLAMIINDSVLLVMLFVISFCVTPHVTIVVVSIMGFFALIMYKTVVRKTQSFGKQQAIVEDVKHKLAFATISAIKDIKVMGIESDVIKENTEISKQFYATTWRFNLLGVIPRLSSEFITFGGLCVGVIVLIGMHLNLADVLPLVGVSMIAVMRILPSLNRIISSVNTFKFYRPFVSKIIEFYEKTNALEVDVVDCFMPFDHDIEVKNICFSYGEHKILSDVSISIHKGQSIGIVGMSGSGKSTLLDLISGIQEKDNGEILLDGKSADPFNTNVIRRRLGYVPQSIALVDESIAFNITFSHEWDPIKLRNALKTANLLEFVEGLVEQEKTMVGENGVRLSGGQRQRIGIARALYRDPDILMFDEATSAVDNITEQELTKEIGLLSGRKTLIIVAHRLSTIQNCDCIYVIHKGRNAGHGSYDELLKNNSIFQEMLKQEVEV